MAVSRTHDRYAGNPGQVVPRARPCLRACKEENPRPALGSLQSGLSRPRSTRATGADGSIAGSEFQPTHSSR